MEYSRRSFLSVAVGGIGTLLLNDCIAANSFFDPYDIVELGNTGVKTTRLCMGTGIRGGNRQSNLTRMGYEQAEKLIREVYNRGVRMFDMADTYGTHEFITNALRNFPRKDYVLFTKMWCRRNATPDGVLPGYETEDEVERFLKEMQTDYIDGLQLHCLTSGNWNSELSEYMTRLDKLKQKGIIRTHGVSVHSFEALEKAVDEPWVDTIHVRFNPFGVKMDASAEQVEPVVKQLHQAGKGVVAMKIIAEGDFADSDEQKDDSFRYALQSGVVDVLNIGMDKNSDIEDSEKRIRKVGKNH